MATGDPIRLVVFDCDGTLVDSQHNIFAAMAAACGECGYAEPSLAEVRGIVGLSLIEAVARLLPAASGAEHARVTACYKQHFSRLRQSPRHHEPLFAGTRACLDRLTAAGFLLGVATGKSRRGLDATLAAHGLGRYFVTLQTADRTPGKPSPVMLQQAMAETGADARRTIIVGDTTFDIEMGRNAGVSAVGVGWGYHPAWALRRAGATALIERFDDLAALALDLTAGGSPSAANFARVAPPPS
jgi:phosphoglycolate phosphatase